MAEEATFWEKLQRQRRLAVESLLERSNLRDELDDAQAGKLLAWAQAQLDEAVQQAQEETDGEEVLAQQATAVAGIMRRINQLIPVLRSSDSDEAHYQIDRLLEDLPRFRDVDPAALRAHLLTAQQEDWSRQQIFAYLFHLIQPESEEGTDA